MVFVLQNAKLRHGNGVKSAFRFQSAGDN